MRTARVLLTAFAGIIVSIRSFGTESRPPNIVVILADDFGVGDIHALYPSNKLATPNLDRLVQQGMHFTDAHSGSAVCSPTRYGLLTGRYAWRTRLQEWVLACYEPPLIDAKRLTLPAYLRQHGYHTACIGKWHIGWEWPGPQPSRFDEEKNVLRNVTWDFTKPIRSGPTERGFDEYFGVDLPNYPPFTFLENDHVAIQPTTHYKYEAKNPQVMAALIDGVPMAPDWQFEEILPEITRRAVNHIKQRAGAKEPFFLYFAMTSPHEPIAPSKQFAGKSGIAPIADFLMETDWSAGQVIKAIDDAGIGDDTIVIFTADNGHSSYTGFAQLVKAGIQPSGPYRGAKGDIWEGGHRVPFIIRWPKKIPANSASRQVLCLTDLFATCAALLSDQLPADTAEDSFSFLPEIVSRAGNSGLRPNLVSHSLNGEFAYREDGWKIVFKMPNKDLPSSRGKPAVVQLYDLNNDVAEKNNLVNERPEIVAKLTQCLQDVVDRGRSRPGPATPNDTHVRFDSIQKERWAPPLN